MNFDNAKEMLKKQAKRKILLWIAPAIPTILIILIFIVIIGTIFGPLITASGESNDNTYSSKEEEKFWKILKDSNLNCERSTLVTATVLYYYQNNPQIDMDFGEEPLDEDYESIDNTVDNGTIDEDEAYPDVPYGKLLPDLKRLIKQIKKGNTKYEKYVKEKFLRQDPYKSLYEGYSDENKKIDEIYETIQGFANTIECKSSTYSNATCKFDVDGGTATDLKVRLLRCGNIDNDISPLEDEELIDFEKYITGVVYQESGDNSLEALKVQAIAARSYVLTRGKIMGGEIGKIQNESGQWTLSIRACTADQVYCDPDNGCWSNVLGGSIAHANGKDASVYSGFDANLHDINQSNGKLWGRGPLPEDSLVRQAVEETAGMVVIDSDQNIINTTYLNTDQMAWEVMATDSVNPKDHYEILMKYYENAGATDIASNCTLVNGAVVGDFTNWKQCDPNWGSTPLGDTTLCDVGCLVTSTAIQIASSGTEILIDDFNPGTFLKHISSHGGLSGNMFTWTGWHEIVPNFSCTSGIHLTGDKQSKANQILDKINEGNYVILGVRNEGHWVAVNYVDGENVYIVDPTMLNGIPKGIINLWDYYSLSGVVTMGYCWKTD